MRSNAARLDDIHAAIDAIEAHLSDGSLHDGIVYDAVRMRLVEIGEATNALDPDLVITEPGIRWRQIGGMRNRLTHEYWDTQRAIVELAVNEELPRLRSAIERIGALLEPLDP